MSGLIKRNIKWYVRMFYLFAGKIPTHFFLEAPADIGATPFIVLEGDNCVDRYSSGNGLLGRLKNIFSHRGPDTDWLPALTNTSARLQVWLRWLLPLYRTDRGSDDACHAR